MSSRYDTCHACRLFNKVDYHEDWKVREPKQDENYLVRWDNEGEMYYESLETIDSMYSLCNLKHITVHWFKRVNPEDYELKVSRKVCCEWCDKEFNPYDDVKSTDDGYMHDDCQYEWLHEQFAGYSLTYEEMVEELNELDTLLK